MYGFRATIARRAPGAVSDALFDCGSLLRRRLGGRLLAELGELLVAEGGCGEDLAGARLVGLLDEHAVGTGLAPLGDVASPLYGDDALGLQFLERRSADQAVSAFADGMSATAASEVSSRNVKVS